MAYSASVLPVMIASPSDVLDYRTAAREVLHERNYVHSLASGVVLMPVGWETHAAPDLGAPAQDRINERILDHCDLLVAVFWTRLGTPTAASQSGSAEEIQRHVAAGRPAMVYFSRSPAALETVDHDQYQALLGFRAWCERQGLIELVDNPTDFQWKLRRQLQISLNESEHIRRLLGQRVVSSLAPQMSTVYPGQLSLSSIASSLHERSRTLLLAASRDEEGLIKCMSLFSGPSVEAAGESILFPTDRDSQTLWNHMLPQLLELGVVVTAGLKAPRLNLYRITPLGRDVAQYIRDGEK